jgi:ParB-like chromosome segregation protein Spo0J
MLRKSHRRPITLNKLDKTSLTPWQRVFQKFEFSQSKLAMELGCHRSKISRALSDEKGLISGSDQEEIFRIAAKHKIKITAEDVTPWPSKSNHERL